MRRTRDQPLPPQGEDPLFTDEGRRIISKTQLRWAISTTLTASGQGDHCHTGEHAMRVSGAQLLAKLGVQPQTIMLMGRWSSNSVARYVQEAPLHHLQSTLPEALLQLENLETRQTGSLQSYAAKIDPIHRDPTKEEPAYIPATTSTTPSPPGSSTDPGPVHERLQALETQMASFQQRKELWILNPRTGLRHTPRVREEDIPPNPVENPLWLEVPRQGVREGLLARRKAMHTLCISLRGTGGSRRDLLLLL